MDVMKWIMGSGKSNQDNSIDALQKEADELKIKAEELAKRAMILEDIKKSKAEIMKSQERLKLAKPNIFVERKWLFIGIGFILIFVIMTFR